MENVTASQRNCLPLLQKEGSVLSCQAMTSNKFKGSLSKTSSYVVSWAAGLDYAFTSWQLSCWYGGHSQHQPQRCQSTGPYQDAELLPGFCDYFVTKVIKLRTFKHFYCHRKPTSKEKIHDFMILSPLRFLLKTTTTTLPSTDPWAHHTYGSFDLGIKVPSSFIRSLILNLLLRSTLGKTAQMLQVIYT